MPKNWFSVIADTVTMWENWERASTLQTRVFLFGQETQSETWNARKHIQRKYNNKFVDSSNARGKKWAGGRHKKNESKCVSDYISIVVDSHAIKFFFLTRVVAVVVKSLTFRSVGVYFFFICVILHMFLQMMNVVMISTGQMVSAPRAFAHSFVFICAFEFYVLLTGVSDVAF